MVVQHANWLHTAAEFPWREPVPSLNYLITSHMWRQDHNGASHQDPGFIDQVLSKRPGASRVYLPPDANCLLHVFDHCLRSRGRVNVKLLRDLVPVVRVRVVNVVDLARLFPPDRHPRGISDELYAEIFPRFRPTTTAPPPHRSRCAP
jgi:phosphoketolase